MFDNLPQLLDSRGGSHGINVPVFDKDDFTSWKIRFLMFLDGLKPYLITTLEDGPFVPMPNLSTPSSPLLRCQNQWSNAESRLANQDKRLKRPSDTRDTKIATLRLKFNAFKALKGEVNADDTANKSLSMTCVQPVTQPKAPTAKNPRKKKILSSTQPKSLEASISAEVQDNQPKVVDAIELLDEVDNHNKAVQESSERFETADSNNLLDNEVSTSDHIVQDDNASAERMTLPNHMDHICKEVSFLHLKLSDIEYSIAEINSSLPTLITNALKEQLLDLLSTILKDCLPSIIKDSLQTHIPAVSEKFIETQTQLNKKVIKQLNRKLNVAHVAQSNRFVILQKELSKVIRSELQDVKDLLESAVIIDETAEGEKKKKDENAIPASNQGEHQTAKNITTPEPTPETQGELAFKESAMVLYYFKELLVDLAADSKLSLSSPEEPTPPIDESKWKVIATKEPPTDELVSFQAKRLGLPPSPELVNFGLTAEEKKRKRAKFVKEVFITEDVRVDGMGRNLIRPPRVIPIQGLVISEPESGIFFMNGNTNIEVTEEIFRKMIYVIEARSDCNKARKIVEMNLDNRG
nr:hypothetical protein [Tanacetum cinerariifolium]